MGNLLQTSTDLLGTRESADSFGYKSYLPLHLSKKQISQMMLH